MGLMQRREFLVGAALASVATPQSVIDVEVMEVFSSSSGPSGLLVHHANEATRDAFANWLRSNSGKQITCVLRNKTQVSGRIFRVSLCFGRGLILLNAPSIEVRAKDVLRFHEAK
jgi:hypothetical protein